MENDKYRNLKNGKTYIVMYHAIDCTNARDGNIVLVYSPEDNPSHVFVRDEDEFMIKFVALDYIGQN